MKPETATVSYVITLHQKGLIEKWASEQDRSASSIIRQIIDKEALRREQALQAHTPDPTNPQSPDEDFITIE